MDVTPIIARLQAQLTGFVAIGGAADADMAVEFAPRPPCAYVVPMAETAEPSELLGLLDQRLTQTFLVLLVVANLRDPTGSAAAADLAAKRLQLRTALLGWVPDTATGEPVEFVSGALLQFKEQALWWRDVFQVKTYYRSA